MTQPERSTLSHRLLPDLTDIKYPLQTMHKSTPLHTCDRTEIESVNVYPHLVTMEAEVGKLSLEAT